MCYYCGHVLLMLNIQKEIQYFTILYNQFRDVVEWQREHWKNRIEKETNEPYQMIYIDISIINKKNKKIYFYSSYDLSSGDEYGIGINLCIKRKKIK